MDKRLAGHSASHCRTRAFTLVEFLVVMAVIAAVFAMVLPAVQKVREASNRMVCANHLRQIALAAHHFASDHGRLPPGYLGPSLSRNVEYPGHLDEGQWIGHFPLLLPYLEQDALLARLRVDWNLERATKLPWWDLGQRDKPHHENLMVAMTPIRVFRCPTAPNYQPEVGRPGPGGGGTSSGLHVFNSRKLGPFTDGYRIVYINRAAYRYLAKTNYMGVAGCGTGTHPFFNRFAGIYTNRSKLSLGQVSTRDGTSNTLLYGEACGTMAWGSRPETRDICWMAGGGLGTYLGLEHARFGTLISFSSWHSPGVQFAFADTSVRLVRYGSTRWSGGRRPPNNPDWLLLQQLAGWKDGSSSDFSSLLD